MSNVQRYEFVESYEAAWGAYVRHDDYVALQACVAELEAALQQAQRKVDRGCVDCTSDPRRADAASILRDYATEGTVSTISTARLLRLCRLALGVSEKENPE